MVRATDFYSEEDYLAAVEEASAPLATEGEADREFARNVGQDNPDRAWILSDRDCWYANPFYQGPAVRHPEDDSDDDREEDAEEVAALQARWAAEDLAAGIVSEAVRREAAGPFPIADDWGDDLPF